MKTAIRRIGKSQGVLIPIALLSRIGAKPGDEVDVKVMRGKLAISVIRRNPRAAWAEESKAIAEAGEGGLVWPEFGNEGDKDWTW